MTNESTPDKVEALRVMIAGDRVVVDWTAEVRERLARLGFTEQDIIDAARSTRY